MPLRRCSIQHILTERIFRTVFNRSDFTSRNIIAVEIEKVSAALMHHAMSRDVFLEPLDRFYVAIEQAAALCKDFSQKQHFLNTFYEKFFQGFSEDVADTHGIVYTPQPNRRFHGEQRVAHLRNRVRAVVVRYRCSYHRSFRRHGQFYRPSDAGHPRHSVGRKISTRVAL